MNQVEESVRLLVDTWQMFTRRMPDGVAIEKNGISTALCDVPLQFLNVCVQNSPCERDEELRRRVGTARELASGCSHPWMLALCEEWMPGSWHAVAEDLGLGVVLSLTGMATDALKPPRRPLPELEYRRVTDDRTARDIAEINMHAYGMTPETIECICNMNIWKEDTEGWVGYLDGRAVTSSAAFPVNGTVYIGFVATLPDAHGKGLAEAVMRRSIEEGRKSFGFERTTLHASEAGVKLYEAMGYERNSRFHWLAQAE